MVWLDGEYRLELQLNLSRSTAANSHWPRKYIFTNLWAVRRVWGSIGVVQIQFSEGFVGQVLVYC